MSQKNSRYSDITVLEVEKERIKERSLDDEIQTIAQNEDIIVANMQERLFKSWEKGNRPYFPLKTILVFNEIAEYNNSPEAEYTGPICLQHTDITDHPRFLAMQSLMMYHGIMMTSGVEDAQIQGENGQTYNSDFKAAFTRATVIFSHDIEKTRIGNTVTGAHNLLEMTKTPLKEDACPDLHWTPPRLGRP